MIIKAINEYGIPWVINRVLYSCKIKMMTILPFTEKLFEKNIRIDRIDIFNIQKDKIKEFLQRLPDYEKNRLINSADNAAKGVIKCFSSLDLDYGYPINWHYNPITDKIIDSHLKWYKIKDFDTDTGDIKVVWEASRFTHFLLLARAYLLTDNIKYYKAFSEQLSGWLTDNHYSYGANFKCGQECAIRMINTLLSYTIFSDTTTTEDKINVKKLIEVCYKKILSNFFYAHKCIKNNHTLSEICGLIIGAWCSGNYARLSKAYDLLDKEIIMQFMPDGGYIQYSFNYQRFALQLMECIHKLSYVTGLSISEKSKEYIINSALLMYQCQDMTCDMPNYGANDGALIFPVTVCDYRNFTAVINTVYALYAGKRLYEFGSYDEELLWFGNDNEYSKDTILLTSSSFRDAGIYTLRNKNGYLTVYLAKYKTRPSHMDGLHIDLWHNGRNIFCDTGSYSYADGLGKTLVDTGSHNTVKVDNKDQMSRKDHFLTYNWYTHKDISFKEDMFRGTLVSRNGYEHIREIRMLSDGYMITDSVKGDGEACEFHFNTPYEVKKNDEGLDIYDNNVLICTIYTNNTDVMLVKKYRSLYYLKKNEITQIILKKKLSKICNNIIHIKLFDKTEDKYD